MAAQGGAAGLVGLTPESLHRLDHLALRTRRAMPGQAAGPRLSPRPGASVEFSDFRTYVAGDDFRRVDWNAYARLDRLILKLYLGEEDLSVNLWVDTSASMDWGEPSKALAARRMAGALAYVGLTNLDRVGIAGFNESVVGALGPLRGKESCFRLWHALAGLDNGGSTEFSSIAAAARRFPRGLTFIISDFLGDSSPGQAVGRLRQARHEVVMLQLLAPQEIEPEVKGDIALKDVETGAVVEVTVTPALLRKYSEALRSHTARLRSLAASHGAWFLQIRSDEPAEAVLGATMRRLGILG